MQQEIRRTSRSGLVPQIRLDLPIAAGNAASIVPMVRYDPPGFGTAC